MSETSDPSTMLAQGTGPSTVIPRDTADQLVAEHAAARPTAVAVRYGDRILTYAELDARANQIARALIAAGVTPGDPVTTLLEPELDVPAVLLAILKAGASYVPLDPNYPPAHTDLILSDVFPRIMVTRRSLLQRLGIHFAVAVFALDEAADAIAAQPPTAPTIAPDATRIATIFHTSGTTGRPKGAMASHAQLAFFAHAARERFAIAPTDVVPVLARFTFSISIFEVLVPLTAGATIIILDREQVMDPPSLARTLERVTFFHAGPSLMRGVLAAIRRERADPERFARVRHASSGGDMIPPQVLTEMRATFTRAEIFAIYGCTEISCMGCSDEIPREGEIVRTYVGRPFPGTRVRVLDAQLRPVPLGAPGEVYFSGPGVIRGYLDRPELDAERFVDLEGDRYYRTGDVGRWWDGRGLELLGRTDFQVKIRGMRVECAEVEFHLQQMPGIRESVVVLRDLRGEGVLAAFVVRDPTPGFAEWADAAELAAWVRRHLADRLPDYMIPAAVVELAKLPLNHNLKLDRKALPQLLASPSSGPEAATLLTPTEHWLAAVWCELLQRESVGRRDNFFELGGDSLLAMQVILRVRRERGVSLDGMALVRESFAVVALLCEPGSAPAIDETSDDQPSFHAESFHFGQQSSLFGILYRPVSARPSRGVLLCGPIGADDIRPSFVLSLLARRLAERGFTVMRFDYFGTRDSLGETYEGDPQRWRADILAARAELLGRTVGTEIIAVGTRLGGTLLVEALEEAKWAQMILWDPVLDGSAHRATMEAMHARSVRGLVPKGFRRKPRVVSGRRELLGFTWSTSALEALSQTTIGTPRTRVPTRISWLATIDGSAQREAFERLSANAVRGRFSEIPFELGWKDHAKVLELMPDPGIVRSIIELAESP